MVQAMIKLNNTWYLGSDENSVTVFEEMTHKKTGKKYKVGRWYYPDFRTALEGLTNRDIQRLDKLELIVERIEKLRHDILSLANVLDKGQNATG